jgi:chaperonin cofactor prefoldin
MSSSLEQLQVVVAEVQAARQQVSSVRAQAQELANTIEAVKAQPADLSLHRQLGGVLVEVGDRSELLSELEASQEALATHLKRFEEREQQLVATYDELKRSLEGATE